MSDNSSEINQKQIGDYLLLELVGSGNFANCYTAMHIPTKERVAIKIIDIQKLNSDEISKARLFSEIAILKKIRHKNIIKLYEEIETPEFLYLVMEYCDSGELFDYIVTKEQLNEKQACVFYQDIIDALSYLHSQNISHRDVKPENILLDKTPKRINCKLIDFGLSKIYEKNQLLETPCGTTYYSPPEVLRNEPYNGLLADVWSTGVLLFSMVCGFLPFNEDDEDENIKKIIAGDYYLPEEDISPELADLIVHLLDIDSSTRYTFEQIREHPWFKIVSKKDQLIQIQEDIYLWYPS